LKIIKIVLKIKSPSTEAADLDFNSLSDEILEASLNFNDKFRDWSKRLIVNQIAKRSIHMLLIMEKEKNQENLSAREIRSFTSYLRTNKGWFKYTKDPNKMFAGVDFIAVAKREAEELLNKAISNEHLFVSQEQDILFMQQQLERGAAEVELSEYGQDLNDEDAMVVMEYLLKTQDKGSRADKKLDDVMRIKTILKKWL
jgi:hypothetical protein